MTAEWEPPGIAPWLGFATDSTAVLGRSSRCSGTRFVEPPSEARLTVYGCEGGSGTVELRAGSITGRLLDSITITVRTPTPTPTPVTPSGELSATKTSIVVGDEVTVSAVNVSPSGQSVYIVTNGRLGFAGPGTCHFEIGPRSSGKSTRSWTLEGCSPPGSGSVTLKTSHNGQTLVLDSITIDVSPAPTATPTPNTPLPTATPPAVSNLVATASTTSVRLSWNELDGASKYRVEHRLATSTGAWTRVDTTAYARNVTNLAPDTSYAFKIRAYGDGTKYEAAWGAEAATTVSTVALAKPPAPAGLGASAPSGTAGRVTLTWSRLTGADKYEVEYRRSGSAQGQGDGAQGRSAGNWVSHDDAITAPGPTITHHVDGLTCGQEHDFRVQSHGDPATALYLDDWGEQWATISETPQCGTTPPTPEPSAPPATPGGLTGTAGPGIVTLEWDVVAGAATYEVEQWEIRSWLPDRWVSLPFDGFVSNSPGIATAIVARMSNGETYKHRVRSRNAHGTSEWATVTTELPELPAPTSFTASISLTIGQISLRWDAVDAATSYEVEQKDGSWKTPPLGNATFSLTGTSAEAGNLVYGKRYEYRVRSRNAGGPSEWVEAGTTLPTLVARGHQHDHTVGYRIAITPVAGYDSALPNPGVIIPSAVATAVSAWNSAGAGAGLVICRQGAAGCDDRNADTFIVTVMLADDNRCGSYACVIHEVQEVYGSASTHLAAMQLIFEEPALLGRERYRWTNVAADNNEDVGRESRRQMEVRWGCGDPRVRPHPGDWVAPFGGRGRRDGLAGQIQDHHAVGQSLPDETILRTRARGVRGGASHARPETGGGAAALVPGDCGGLRRDGRVGRDGRAGYNRVRVHGLVPSYILGPDEH